MGHTSSFCPRVLESTFQTETKREQSDSRMTVRTVRMGNHENHTQGTVLIYRPVCRCSRFVSRETFVSCLWIGVPRHEKLIFHRDRGQPTDKATTQDSWVAECK